MNPSLTPAELLRIMDGCLALHREAPAPAYFRKGVRWHARMGFNLLIFAHNLSVIVRQLETDVVNLQHFLGDTTEESEELAA